MDFSGEGFPSKLDCAQPINQLNDRNSTFCSAPIFDHRLVYGQVRCTSWCVTLLS